MALAAIPTPAIPIAHLRPELDAESTSVTGIVTLIWPYASSTRSISLLLVEPDFRLRRHRGQVRIHFHGSGGKAVEKASIRCGDKLLLSLKGAEWVEDATTATTPGKGIEWDLRYRERVFLEVRRSFWIEIRYSWNDRSSAKMKHQSFLTLTTHHHHWILHAHPTHSNSLRRTIVMLRHPQAIHG